MAGSVVPLRPRTPSPALVALPRPATRLLRKPWRVQFTVLATDLDTGEMDVPAVITVVIDPDDTLCYRVMRESGGTLRVCTESQSDRPRLMREILGFIFKTVA